jgi:hypothetical protein
MDVKFVARTAIEGNIAIEGPIHLKYCLLDVAVYKENDMYILSVSKVIRIEKSDLLEISRNKEKRLPLNVDKYLDDKMIEVFRNVETFGGFMHGITKVYYEEYLELLWVDTETNNILFKMHKSLKEHKKVVLTEKALSNILNDSHFIPNATIPYNFYREAQGYLNRINYVSAYIDFYMILEYCFADGQYKKNQTDKFKQSSMLKIAVLTTIKIMKDTNNSLYQEISGECLHRYKKKMDFESIIDLLYRYRGDLSHAPKRARYESNQEKLKPITMFIASICFTVCGNMKVYCDKFISAKRTEERVNKRIQDLELELELE